MIETRGLLDVAGAASYLSVTERWVRRAVDERRIPYIKLGRLLRFDPDALDAWVAANAVTPGQAGR